jgi:hypothetical protein
MIRLEFDAERACPDDALATPTTQLVAAYTPAPASATPNEVAIAFARAVAPYLLRSLAPSPPPRRGMSVFRKQASKSTNNLYAAQRSGWGSTPVWLTLRPGPAPFEISARDHADPQLLDNSGRTRGQTAFSHCAEGHGEARSWSSDELSGYP